MKSPPARLLAFVLLSGILASIGCDPFPDECDDDDNVCEGNIANVCASPYAEGRKRTTRIDCGARACAVAYTGYAGGNPQCVDKGAPECLPGDPCADDTAQCTRLTNGRHICTR